VTARAGAAADQALAFSLSFLDNLFPGMYTQRGSLTGPEEGIGDYRDFAKRTQLPFCHNNADLIER
jgi:hypothetical protein